MATMDIFRHDAFRTRSLGDAINHVPNMWGRIGELGLFEDRSIRTPQFMLEQMNGVLQLVQSSQRGAPMPGARSAKRAMRPFATRRFALETRITSDEIDGIRAFGTESELKQVGAEVNERLVALRGSLDITREYLRAGALRGEVLDADGTTIVNLHDEFDVTPKEVNFLFGTPSGVPAKVAEVTRHIQLNLLGDIMTGVHALCSPEFFDKLLANAEFKEAHRYYTSVAEPLRQDVSRGVPWLGVTWELYLGVANVPNEDGTWTERRFIPAGDARFFPVGTRTTFRQFNAPADYMEAVNTPGLPFYAKIAPDLQWNQFVDVQAQMNTMPICMRPAVLVRGHSST